MVHSFPTDLDSVQKIVHLVEEAFLEKGVNEKLSHEYQLLIEELSLKLIEGAGLGAQIDVTVSHNMGHLRVKLDCVGQPVFLGKQDPDDFGGQILEEFSDYLSQSYSAGVNHVTFQPSSIDKMPLICLISLASAILVGSLFRFIATPETQQWVIENLFYPIVLVFANCMQAIALPTAFFSLSAFIITFYLTLDRNSNILKIAVRYIVTSLVAMLISTLMWRIYCGMGVKFDVSDFQTVGNHFMGTSIRDFLSNLVSTDIVTPFLISNPLPMLMLSIILGVAASTLFGQSGQIMRHAIGSINSICERMINMIYGLLPYFLFVAVLQRQIKLGFAYELIILKSLAIFILPILLMLVVYAIQLRINGVKVRDFLHNFSDVLWENLKIGSNIAALPYNKRMIYRKTKMQSSLLKEGLILGNLMNMDGNCLTISLGILILVSSAGIGFSVAEGIGLAFIIILLSIGAPNQPGSFMLCMIVLMMYVGISADLYGDILIIEAFLGKFYSCLNSVGDVVTMVSFQSSQKRKKLAAK